MSEHLDEGLLQAWLDGELPAEADERVARHLDACADCRAGADVLRELEVTTRRALLGLNGRPDVERARWEVRRRWAAGRSRRVRHRTAAAAAVLVLFAGGVAAALPGSPVREWIAGFVSDPDVLPVPALEETAGPDAGVDVALGADGTAEVNLLAARAGLGVEVVAAEVAVVEVRAPEGARFLSAPGRGSVEVDLSGIGSGGEVRIVVPAVAREVAVRAEGRVLVRWTAGTFEVDEGISSEADAERVRLRVPGQGGGEIR